MHFTVDPHDVDVSVHQNLGDGFTTIGYVQAVQPVGMFRETLGAHLFQDQFAKLHREMVVEPLGHEDLGVLGEPGDFIRSVVNALVNTPTLYLVEDDALAEWKANVKAPDAT